jgi:hypothetical protein
MSNIKTWLYSLVCIVWHTYGHIEWGTFRDTGHQVVLNRKCVIKDSNFWRKGFTRRGELCLRMLKVDAMVSICSMVKPTIRLLVISHDIIKYPLGEVAKDISEAQS